MSNEFFRKYIDIVNEAESKKNKFDQSGSLVDFTDTDKWDNFVPPDEEDDLDYQSGRMDKEAPELAGYLQSPKRAKYRLTQWLKDNPEFKKKN